MWATKKLNHNVPFGADGLKYCFGENGRNDLINTTSWIITDAGKDCTSITPTVTITSNTKIIENNQTTYPISGTCTDSAGDVTITIGTISKVVACNGGNFSDTVDVSALPDGNVTINASQTWGTQTGNAPQITVEKDTTKPTIEGTNTETFVVGSAEATSFDPLSDITATDDGDDITNRLNCSVNPNYDASLV